MNKLKQRRFKRKFSDKKIKYIFIIVFIFVFMLSSAYALYRTTLNISGRATIGTSECDYNISATYEITNTWTQGNTSYYDISISVHNRDSESIVDWEMNLGGPSDLAVGWMNGNYTIDNGNLRITPLSYNNTIASGETLTFPFNVSTVEEELDFEYITFNDCTIYGEGGSQDDPLTSITISPKTATIMETETTTLSITKVPSYKKIEVTWTSSDTSIATVDSNGNVTGVSVGTATITASSEGITDTATITVTENTIVLESITVSPNSYRMGIGDLVPLQVEKSPSNAPATITWTSSDPSVATVDSSGLVTGVSAGTATITATAGELTSTCTITVRDAFASNDVSISRELISGGYTSGDSFQFRVTITNLTDEIIPYFKITYNIPTDVTWSNWQPQTMTFIDNYHENIVTEQNYNAIPANGTFTYSGTVTFPNSYLIDSTNEWGQSIKKIPDEYLELEVLNVEFN